MNNIMILREAVKKGLIQAGTEVIEYNPDIKEIEIPSPKTGTQQIQTFKTANLCWTLVELKRGQLALIASTSTNQFLTLYGERGARKSKKVLNNICEIWSSKKLGLRAKSINPTDYKELPKSIRESIRNIWISEYCDFKDDKDTSLVVYFINKNANYGKYALSSKKNGERSLSAEVRPIIYLPDDILIDLATKKLYKDFNQVSKVKLENIIQRLESNTEITNEIILDLKEILNNM